MGEREFEFEGFNAKPLDNAMVKSYQVVFCCSA